MYVCSGDSFITFRTLGMHYFLSLGKAHYQVFIEKKKPAIKLRHYFIILVGYNFNLVKNIKFNCL
jgi:hypothetical protein